MTDWTDLVQKTLHEGRLTNPAYQFKDALKDAQKIYRKSKSTISKNITYKIKGKKNKKNPKRKTVRFKKMSRKQRK